MHRKTQKKSEPYPEIISLILAFLCRISGIRANLFVIFLKRCEIFTSLRKFALNIRKLVSDVPTMNATKTYLLHTLTYVPVHKGTLRVHEVKFVVLEGVY